VVNATNLLTVQWVVSLRPLHLPSNHDDAIVVGVRDIDVIAWPNARSVGPCNLAMRAGPEPGRPEVPVPAAV